MSGSAEALYREHGQALFTFLVRTTGDRDLAGDVLHDTFQRLMEKPPREDTNKKAWLFRVAINRLRDVQRRAHRHTRALRAMPAEGALADPSPTPNRAVAVLEARQTAATLLASLTERDRQILLMRAEGFTHREIAEAVGTTTKSIGTMIARSLRRVSGATHNAETGQ